MSLVAASNVSIRDLQLLAIRRRFEVRRSSLGSVSMVSGSAGYPDRAKARDRAQRWGELAGTGRNMGVISCIVAKLYGSTFICMPFATVAPDAYNRGLLGLGLGKTFG